MHDAHKAASTSRRHLCISGQEARFPPTDTSDTDKNPAGAGTNGNCVSQGCRRRRKGEHDLETTEIVCPSQMHAHTLTTPTTPAVTGRLDLLAYARKHRYRVRNLHDGGPVPPAIWKPPKGFRPTYVGEYDRMDAVVGRDGYIVDEGEPGRLGIALFYKSGKGVNRARARLAGIGGTVTQEGDTEVAGTIPVESIDAGRELIRVSRLRPGDVSRFAFAPTQSTNAARD